MENEEVIGSILEEFGLDKADAHIVNGHVPVEQIHGESPIKCGGKLLIIDGGFSKAYQKKTGIAGYTLVCNSRGMRLVAHEPFESTEAAILKESDIFSDSIVVENFPGENGGGYRYRQGDPGEYLLSGRTPGSLPGRYDHGRSLSYR